jgi:hypothetical protein
VSSRGTPGHTYPSGLFVLYSRDRLLDVWAKVHLYLTRDQLWLTQSCHDMDGVVLTVEEDCIDQDEETGKKKPEVFFRLQKNTGSVFSCGPVLE